MTGLARRLARVETRAWRCPACGAACACRRAEDGPTSDIDRELDVLMENFGLELVDTVAADPRVGLSDAQRAALHTLAAERLGNPGGEG